MSEYKKIIQEAELMAMQPQAVADFLQKRSLQTATEAHNDVVEEDTEEALLKRADPLIELSLARYGRHVKVVSKIFNSANATSPVRLACLTNKCVTGGFLQRFPEQLFTEESETIENWISNACTKELRALFENPTLSDDFLRNLLERRNEWKIVTDDKLCLIVSILQSNPRMRTPYEDDYMDGSIEFSYSSVFDAAWKLAENVPTTQKWASALGWLYEPLQTDSFSIKNPLKLAERWHINPEDTQAKEQQEKNHKIGELSDMERVRKGLAKLALKQDYKLLEPLLANNDLAFRAAAYTSGPLNVKQLQNAYEKDGKIVLSEALYNLSLWRRQDTREALKDIAWDVVEKFDDNDLLSANQYQWREKSVREKHPEWFVDEENNKEDDDDVTQLPATKDDISSLTEHLEHQSQTISALEQKLGTLTAKTNWFWWFLLGALVANLRHL